MRRIPGLVAIAGVCLLGVPAIASADNLAVQVGGEVKNKPWIDLQGIYPKKPVVHVGDSIDFSIVGFHTIAVQPTGSTVLPLIVPTGNTYAVQNDAAGAPFWWGGVAPELGFNGAVFTPTSTTFDDTALVHSAPPPAAPTPFSVTFTKAGTYVLACEIHPFMRGSVKVVAADAKVRSFAKQEKKGRQQLRKDAKHAKKLDKKLAKKANKHHGHARSHGHHGTKVAMKATVRTGAGTKRFSLLRFYPSDATVKVGGTVTWKWTGFNEVHTVTILQQPDLDALAGNLFAGPALDPVGALPTEAPGAPVVHSDTVHGNGLLGSGIVPDPAGAAPNTFMAQFTTPGVFTYRCLIHDGMTGTVTVKA
jgi:plastocyanin